MLLTALVIGTPVAIKVLSLVQHKDSVKDATREIRNLCRVAHGNVVKLLDVTRCASHADLVFPYYEDLATFLMPSQEIHKSSSKNITA